MRRSVTKYIPSETGSMMTSTISCTQIMPYSPVSQFIKISSGMFKSPWREKVRIADCTPRPIACRV